MKPLREYLLSKKAGTEKAKFEIAMLSRIFNEQGKAV